MGLEFQGATVNVTNTQPDFTTCTTGFVDLPGVGVGAPAAQLRPANSSRRYLQVKCLSPSSEQIHMSLGVPAGNNTPFDAITIEPGETYVMCKARGNLFLGEIWVQIGAGAALAQVSWMECV